MPPHPFPLLPLPLKQDPRSILVWLLFILHSTKTVFWWSLGSSCPQFSPFRTWVSSLVDPVSFLLPTSFGPLPILHYAWCIIRAVWGQEIKQQVVELSEGCKNEAKKVCKYSFQFLNHFVWLYLICDPFPKATYEMKSLRVMLSRNNNIPISLAEDM